MTQGRPVFQLLDEPWIKVRRASGEVSELSVTELIHSAPGVKAIAGEIPTQDVAVLRLVIAILFASTKGDHPRTFSEAARDWASWWTSGQLPEKQILDYLERYRDRFDLFHPSKPFFQVAGLHTESGRASGLSKLIADVPDGHQYFTTRAGTQLESLSYAEAARWLVHCQAFDPAGIKTGAAGDRRVKGGKGYSMGYPAFAGNLGIVVIEGDNLFETLLLNLPLGSQRDPSDAPVWERELGPGVSSTHPLPVGPADVLTWPSRRVLLHPRDGRVVDVQISNGDPLGPQDQMRNEPMASWRKSAAQTKKAGRDVYMPVTHSPERRIWQGLEALLVSIPGSSHRAPVLDWLAEMQDEVLPVDKRVGFRTVGVEYGTQASSIVGVVDDRLDAQVIGLTDEAIVRAAANGASRVSHAVVAFANLASNLALASGGESDPPRKAAFEYAYSLLDGPFRAWVAGLDDRNATVESLESWGSTAQRILSAAGRELIAQAGPAAVVGRAVAKLGSDTNQLIDAGLAERWFQGALRKALLNPTFAAQEGNS